jgi:hypothetical protein
MPGITKCKFSANLPRGFNAIATLPAACRNRATAGWGPIQAILCQVPSDLPRIGGPKTSTRRASIRARTHKCQWGSQCPLPGAGGDNRTWQNHFEAVEIDPSPTCLGPNLEAATTAGRVLRACHGGEKRHVERAEPAGNLLGAGLVQAMAVLVGFGGTCGFRIAAQGPSGRSRVEDRQSNAGGRGGSESVVGNGAGFARAAF